MPTQNGSTSTTVLDFLTDRSCVPLQLHPWWKKLENRNESRQCTASLSRPTRIIFCFYVVNACTTQKQSHCTLASSSFKMTPRNDPSDNTYGSEATRLLESESKLGRASRTSPVVGDTSMAQGAPQKHRWTPLQALNLAIFACSIMLWICVRQEVKHGSVMPPKRLSTNSKYERVQGIGFQIYTGGARAFVNTTHSDGSVIQKTNPECHGLNSYGTMWTEQGDVLQCYIGNYDIEQDVQARLRIMKEAVEMAYHQTDKDPSTLKVFIAPEFFFRGVNGAYAFEDEGPGDDTICGPACQILKGLEEIVADWRFEDWFFLFGSIVAHEPIDDDRTDYDSLFYNFAPIYKGYDPSKTDHKGKRFIAPKRYLSTSDFMTPQRNVDTSNWKELVENRESNTHQETTVINPIFTRGKYDIEMWVDYKDELDQRDYTLLEFGWLMVDGLSVSLEICLDHQVKTSLNAYTADMTTGQQTMIPSITEKGLQYVHIPKYQAQIGVVSSAGMTLVPESLALTQHGIIFLQDGLSNATNREYWANTGCEFGTQFEGGTEAITRRAFLSSTDVFFEHQTLDGLKRYDLYPEKEWEKNIAGSFSGKEYPPQLTIFDPADIAMVHLD
jgi:hypothetical protein